MAYADFQYYKDIFSGTLISDNGQFGTFSERASEHIDMVTFNRLSDENLLKKYETNVKKCCCALAEKFYLYSKYMENCSDGKSIKSETNGKYSVSYAGLSDFENSFAEISKNQQLKSICYRYFGNTGLLFRGCG